MLPSINNNKEEKLLANSFATFYNVMDLFCPLKYAIGSVSDPGKSSESSNGTPLDSFLRYYDCSYPKISSIPSDRIMTHSYWSQNIQSKVLCIDSSPEMLIQFHRTFIHYDNLSWISEFYSKDNYEKKGLSLPNLRFFMDFDINELFTQEWQDKEYISFAKTIHAILCSLFPNKEDLRHHCRVCNVLVRGASSDLAIRTYRPKKTSPSLESAVDVTLTPYKYSVGIHLIFPDLYVCAEDFKYFHAMIYGYFALLQSNNHDDILHRYPNIPLPSGIVIASIQELNMNQFQKAFDSQVYELNKLNLRYPFCEKVSACCKNKKCPQCQGLNKIWTRDRVYRPKYFFISKEGKDHFISQCCNSHLTSELLTFQKRYTSASIPATELVEFLDIFLEDCIKKTTPRHMLIALALSILRTPPHLATKQHKSPYIFPTNCPAPIVNIKSNTIKGSYNLAAKSKNMAGSGATTGPSFNLEYIQFIIELFRKERYSHLYPSTLTVCNVVASSNGIHYWVDVTGVGDRRCPNKNNNNLKTVSIFEHGNAKVWFDIYLQDNAAKKNVVALPPAFVVVQPHTTSVSIPKCFIVARCRCKCTPTTGGTGCSSFKSTPFPVPTEFIPKLWNNIVIPVTLPHMNTNVTTTISSSSQQKPNNIQSQSDYYKQIANTYSSAAQKHRELPRHTTTTTTTSSAMTSISPPVKKKQKTHHLQNKDLYCLDCPNETLLVKQMSDQDEAFWKCPTCFAEYDDIIE